MAAPLHAPDEWYGCVRVNAAAHAAPRDALHAAPRDALEEVYPVSKRFSIPARRLLAVAALFVMLLAIAGVSAAHAAPLSAPLSIPAAGAPGSYGHPLTLPASWPDTRVTDQPGAGPLTCAYYEVANGSAYTNANISVTADLSALLNGAAGSYCGEMYAYGHWTIYHGCHTFTAAVINYDNGDRLDGEWTSPQSCSGTNQFWESSAVSEPAGGDDYSGALSADLNWETASVTYIYTPN